MLTYIKHQKSNLLHALPMLVETNIQTTYQDKLYNLSGAKMGYKIWVLYRNRKIRAFRVERAILDKFNHAIEISMDALGKNKVRVVFLLWGSGDAHEAIYDNRWKQTIREDMVKRGTWKE